MEPGLTVQKSGATSVETLLLLSLFFGIIGGFVMEGFDGWSLTWRGVNNDYKGVWVWSWDSFVDDLVGVAMLCLEIVVWALCFVAFIHAAKHAYSDMLKPSFQAVKKWLAGGTP